MKDVRKFLTENSLALVLLGLFLGMLIGMSLVGLRHENSELASHDEPLLSYGEYIVDGSFIEAVFENWESEFLQMGAFVILTIWFRQKGSKDSRKLRGQDDVDTAPRYSLLKSSLRHKTKAIKSSLYSNSLSLALFGLFLVSFLLHMTGGANAYNEEAMQHGEETLSNWQYLTTARFWFESLQNWQSEFLAVGALIVLTIFLRQRYSPESGMGQRDCWALDMSRVC